MSSASRTRPTRAETRDRLFEAAAEVFERQGIAGASIEDIASAAGFSRGAFYSNFANKDELVLALLDEHVAVAVAKVEELFAATADPTEFVRSLDAVFNSRRTALDRSPLLFMEFLLYAVRDQQNRPRLAGTLRHMQAAIATIAAESAERLGLDPVFEHADAAATIMALDYGFSLLHLVDPAAFPQGSFSRTLATLQALWVAAAPSA